MNRLIPVLVGLSILSVLVISPVLAAEPVECEQDYVVQSGDRLQKIAETYYGDTAYYKDIVEATNTKAATDGTYKTIENPSYIQAGWKLCLPQIEGVSPKSGGADDAAQAPPGLETEVLMNMTYQSEFGEDGTVQGMFEIAGKPYVGCGVLGSAVAMDKDVARQVMAAAGLSTPRWEVVRSTEFADDPAGTVERITRSLGNTVFVKPASLGSSVGITKAETPAGIKDALDEAFRYGDKAIVDEFIDGREIEVAILEGPRSALPGEVHSANEWYDYDAKYNDEESDFEVPARLTKQRTAEVQALAAMAFTALECRGLARVDFFFEEGGRGFVVNEVNTMPGFTPISGFPKMWMASGMTYAELCNELVDLAI